MTALGPGTLVQALKTFGPYPNEPDIACPQKGVIYRVRETFEQDGKAFLRLAEIRNPRKKYRLRFGEVGWYARHFQPVDDTALDVFRTTNTDLPEDVEVA